jgi:hypothetical protein
VVADRTLKARVTVTTGEQSWLGRLFWVDAVNMLESSMLEAAASDTIEWNLYPYPDRDCAWESDLPVPGLEIGKEQCIVPAASDRRRWGR